MSWDRLIFKAWFLDFLLITNRMVYMVLGDFEKKKWPYVRLKWGLETSFGTPYQKSADTLKFVFTHVSYISQQKKVNTISHVRHTERLTNSLS